MLEAPLEILMLISTLGLDAAIVRSKNINSDDFHSIFGWLLVFNGLLCIAYFGGGVLLDLYFHQPMLKPLAQTLSCIFLLVPFRVVPNALLDRQLKFKLVATIDLIANVVAASTTLTLAIMGKGIWALVIGVLANRATASIMLMIVQPWLIMPRLEIAPLRRMIGFGGSVTLFRLLHIVIEKSVGMIAGPSLGSQGLGIYNISMEFAALPISKTMPIINPIIFPSFSKLQSDGKLAGYYLGRSLGMISLILFPVMVGLACVSNEFITIILGKNWLEAMIPFTLLALIMPFRAITYFIRPVMMGMGRIDLTLKSALLMLIVLIPLVFFSSNYGVIGLVTAWLIAEPIVTLSTVKLGKQVAYNSYHGIYQSLRPAICATLVMACCILWIDVIFGSLDIVVAFAIKVGTGIVAYLLVLMLFFHTELQSAIDLITGKCRQR